jgi:hypothetical protein
MGAKPKPEAKPGDIRKINKDMELVNLDDENEVARLSERIQNAIDAREEGTFGSNQLKRTLKELEDRVADRKAKKPSKPQPKREPVELVPSRGPDLDKPGGVARELRQINKDMELVDLNDENEVARLAKRIENLRDHIGEGTMGAKQMNNTLETLKRRVAENDAKKTSKLKKIQDQTDDELMKMIKDVSAEEREKMSFDELKTRRRQQAEAFTELEERGYSRSDLAKNGTEAMKEAIALQLERFQAANPPKPTPKPPATPPRKPVGRRPVSNRRHEGEILRTGDRVDEERFPADVDRSDDYDRARDEYYTGGRPVTRRQRREREAEIDNERRNDRR